MNVARTAPLTALAGLACLLPSCGWDGHFTVLGYTTRPNYDCSIKTVRVPIFQNKTFRQGLEFDLTRAIVREIEAKTPYKVVSHGDADTELSGEIVTFTKNLVNINQFNEIREGETTLGVAVVWKDLRTGKVLSRPARRPGDPLPAEALADGSLATPAGTPLAGVPVTPSFPTSPSAPAADAPADGGGPAILPPVPDKPPPAPGPVLLSSRGYFIPELGQSLVSAEQQNINRLAVQIVNMMETPW